MSETILRIRFSLTLSQSKRSELLPALRVSPVCTVVQDSFVVAETECYFKYELAGLLVGKRCLGGATEVCFQYPFCLALSVIKARLSQKLVIFVIIFPLHSTNVL